MSTLTQSFTLPPGTLPEGPFDLPSGDRNVENDHSFSSSSGSSTVAGPTTSESTSATEGPICEICACEIPRHFSPAPNDGEGAVVVVKQASSMIVDDSLNQQPDQEEETPQHILPIVCAEGHHVCVHCFSQYMSMTWVNNTRPHLDTLSPENLPEVRCVVEGCTSTPFPRNVVLRHTFTDASDAFLKIHQDIQDIATLSKAQSLMVGAGGENNNNAREQEDLAARALLRAQLQSQGLMLMCPSCGFGPVERFGCTDLTNSSARNSCPACGFYSPNSNDWVNWDGEIRQGAASVGLIHRVVTILLNIWMPICLVLTIAAASTNWFIVQPSPSSLEEGHQCITFKLFYIDIGCTGNSQRIGMVEAESDLGLCGAHLANLKAGAAFSILSMLVMIVTIILSILQFFCGSMRAHIVLPIFWSITWFFSLLTWAPPVAFFTRSFCKDVSISGGLLGEGNVRGDVGLILGVLSWVVTTILLLVFLTVKISASCRRQ